MKVPPDKPANEVYERQNVLFNRLIQVHNDRIAVYDCTAKAMNATDSHLSELFVRLRNESRFYRQQLARHVISHNGKIETNASLTGKTYQVMMDSRAGMDGFDPKTLLENCENCERNALQTFEEALELNDTLSHEMRVMLLEQRDYLKNSQRIVEHFRLIARGKRTEPILH